MRSPVPITGTDRTPRSEVMMVPCEVTATRVWARSDPPRAMLRMKSVVGILCLGNPGNPVGRGGDPSERAYSDELGSAENHPIDDAGKRVGSRGPGRPAGRGQDYPLVSYSLFLTGLIAKNRNAVF